MSYNPRPLVIHHGGCFDGFGAAWAARHCLSKTHQDGIDFHPGVYGNEPPDVKGRSVFILDFSYKPEVLALIIEQAAYTRLIDHHKSACEEFEAAAKAGRFGDVRYDVEESGNSIWRGRNFDVFFNMNHSGAMMTWKFFQGQAPPPKLLEYIEDRDLWRFNLPLSRECHEGLSSYPYDFEKWDDLMLLTPVNEIINDGRALLRKHFQDIESNLAVCKRQMTIGSHVVWVASMPITMTSDAANKLAEDGPFGVCYWDTPEGRVFSLRSTKESDFDVSKVAQIYGGGGHKHAAGFRIPFENLLHDGSPGMLAALGLT